VTGGDQARHLGGVHERHIVVRGFDRTKARLCQSHAIGRQIREIGGSQPRLKDNRAGENPHAARSVVLEAALGRQGERLDARRIARTPGHMDVCACGWPARRL